MGHELDVAISAARDAGAVLLKGYGGDLQVEAKRDKSLVTQIDKESESVVLRHIREAFPEHRVLAEEGGVGAASGEYCWVIDPLDGTHNYIRQAGEFGVSIGLVRDDEFVLGVIYMPVADDLYAAEKGSGAFHNDQPIHVSDVGSLDRASMCYDSSVRYNPDLVAGVLRDLGARVFNTRMFGSSVRQLTYLAAGKVDCSVEFDDKPWDFAAGIAILEEAGGTVCALDGGKLTLESQGYVASNGLIQKELLSIVSCHVAEGQ